MPMAVLNTTLATDVLNYAPARLTEPIGPMVWALEQPLVSALALFVLGIVCASLLWRRDQARLGLIVGGALIALAAAVMALGTLVVTDREQIGMGSRTFVIAAVDGDMEALDRVMLEEAALAGSGRTVADDGRERIKRLSQAQAQAALIESWRISRLQARIDGPNVGTTQFRVRMTPRGGLPTLSWWRLHWRRDAQGVWRIGTIDCLAINGREPGSGLLNWLGGAAPMRGL